MAERFEVLGVEQVRQGLRRFGQSFWRRAVVALYEEELRIQRVSMERTPVKFGALRGSHESIRPVFSSGEMTGRVVVGGPSASYAPYVHEKVELRHRVGQAKFLESAVMDAAPGMPARLAARIGLE